MPAVLVAATVVTGAQLLTQSGPALESGSSLLFPLFAVLTAALVASTGCPAWHRVARSRFR